MNATTIEKDTATHHLDVHSTKTFYISKFNYPWNQMEFFSAFFSLYSWTAVDSDRKICHVPLGE